MKQYGKSWYETFMGDLHTLGVAVTRVSPNEMYKQPVKEEAMKVVKKCDGRSEHNVLDESTDYYLCGERQGMHPYLLAKKDYEPVEEWVPIFAQAIYGDYSSCELRVVAHGGIITVEGRRKR